MREQKAERRVEERKGGFPHGPALASTGLAQSSSSSSSSSSASRSSTSSRSAAPAATIATPGAPGARTPGAPTTPSQVGAPTSSPTASPTTVTTSNSTSSPTPASGGIVTTQPTTTTGGQPGTVATVPLNQANPGAQDQAMPATPTQIRIPDGAAPGAQAATPGAQMLGIDGSAVTLPNAGLAPNADAKGSSLPATDSSDKTPSRSTPARKRVSCCGSLLRASRWRREGEFRGNPVCR